MRQRLLDACCVTAGALALTACALPSALAHAPTAGGAEVVWHGQAAFQITSPGGKIIITDPWLRTDSKTPVEHRKLEAFGRIDVLLVSCGHFDQTGAAIP